jgi:N-acetylneuraminate synthase
MPERRIMAGDRSTWLTDPVPGSPCAVIGEVAQAHDGSLGMAHAFIDAIAAAGADAVKFQTHIAAAESTEREPWRKRFSRQDQTRLDYWRRMEFSPEQWLELKNHATERGLTFLSSPFSLEAVDLLRSIGMSAWKVASGEITNTGLLDVIAETRQPIMLSTGMSAVTEIDAAVARVQSHGSPLAVMQCASLYPCPPQMVGLNVLSVFRERYGTAVGLSDHSATIFPGLAAATLGAEVLEVHVTLSREMFGPDVVASVTTSEFAQLVAGVRMNTIMRRQAVDKFIDHAQTAGLRDIFMKSIVARSDLPAGLVLEARHLAAKKPAGGLPAERMPDLLGRRLRRAVPVDGLLSLEDLEV